MPKIAIVGCYNVRLGVLLLAVVLTTLYSVLVI